MSELNKFVDWYNNLNQNKTANVYSPHKPLTIIYALNKILKGHRWIEFNRDRKELEEFIEKFIPAKPNCLYPLWRLQNDNKKEAIWAVNTALAPNKSGDISVTQATESNLKAGFIDSTYEWFANNLGFVQFFIGEIIEDNFPETLEEEIIIALGLDLEVPQIVTTEIVTRTINQAKRDPLFPKKVMQAYDYRCGFCQLKIYQNQKPFPMEAAHIKWKARGGECHETNGLSLCPTHHYTFDKGVWSLDQNLEIILNPSVLIDQTADLFFAPFLGRNIIRAILDKKLAPSEEYVEWHRTNIFKS